MMTMNTELLFAFENGELNDDEVITLFQQIYDTKAYLWLQGFYGRTLKDLIEEGLISL